jgi:cobalt transporter subunit CbtB
MTTETNTLPLGSDVRSASRLLQLGFAALLGLLVVGVAGFSHIDAVHNATHDVRHSMAFPCH